MLLLSKSIGVKVHAGRALGKVGGFYNTRCAALFFIITNEVHEMGALTGSQFWADPGVIVDPRIPCLALCTTIS